MQKFEAGNDQQSGHSMSSSTRPAYAHPPTTINYHPPLPIFIAIVFSILFFFGFFAIYFFRCLLENLFALCNRRRNPSGALVAAANPSMSTGLDPEHIQSFPTFYFSSVKEYRREKYGLECAICLGEFNDDDMLRLLTICCHVFHKECIDLWLESHKTCPVCRGELDIPRNSLDKPPLLARNNSMHEHGAHQTSLQDAVCIDIKEDNNEEVGGRESEAQACSSTRIKIDKMKQKFSRSHSTGHSIPRTRDDRYTLRLRDRVKIKIIKGHNSAASCIAFGEFSSPSYCRKEDFGQSSETNPGDLHKVS